MNKEEKNVVVVSIDKYSFDILMNKKFYAFPKNSRRIEKYFAFYKDGEINYYGIVKSEKEVNKLELGIGYWLYCFPDSEPPFKMVTFDKLIKFKNPIKRDVHKKGKGYIQGRIYTTYKKLMKAKTISDLS